MFEVNTIFLYKFGWVMTHWAKEYPWVFHAPDRIYSILYENDKVYFIKSKGTFDLDKKGYPNRTSSFYNVSSHLKKEENIEEKIEIKSNVEMVNCIKKNDACIKEYQRHFKLSSILNK
jgi:hypothetical protein